MKVHAGSEYIVGWGEGGGGEEMVSLGQAVVRVMSKNSQIKTPSAWALFVSCESRKAMNTLINVFTPIRYR